MREPELNVVERLGTAAIGLVLALPGIAILVGMAWGRAEVVKAGADGAPVFIVAAATGLLMALYGIDIVNRAWSRRGRAGVFEGPLGTARALVGFVTCISVPALAAVEGHSGGGQGLHHAYLLAIGALFCGEALLRKLWRKLRPQKR